MSTIAPTIRATWPGPAGRLLIVEPDGHRASLLDRILRPFAAIDLRIVPRVTDAVRAMAEAIPDLVVTSPLLSPGDESVLWTQIRRTIGASHVQVINLPYAIEPVRPAAREGTRGSVFQFLRRSSGTVRAACDASTVREEIAQYLAQAVAQREEANARVLVPDAPAISLVEPQGIVRQRDQGDRRRASRRTLGDLPGTWTVRLPWGSDVRLVDVSNSGVLFESASKISPGVTVDLQFLGGQRNIFVPARMLRADVARVDAFGVKYQMAAAFGREVRLVDFDAAVGLSSPRVLTDLLARVLTDAEGLPTAADVTTRFETELRRLLPRRDIRIRTTPSSAHDGAESIYFTLEQRPGSPRILQVTFESGSAPTEMEFKLLKAAARLAAVALDIAQMSASGS